MVHWGRDGVQVGQQTWDQKVADRLPAIPTCRSVFEQDSQTIAPQQLT